MLKRVWSRDQASFVKSLFSRMSADACARATFLSRWKRRFWGAQSRAAGEQQPAASDQTIVSEAQPTQRAQKKPKR